MPYKDPEKRKEASKRWRVSNPDKQKKSFDSWRVKNLEKDRKRLRDNSKKNREGAKKASRNYRLNNPEKIKEYRYNYEKDRLKKDPSFKFINNLRTRQRSVLKGKTSTTKGLGCSGEGLVHHLSSKFTEGMTLENHGYGENKWNIEHIIPLVSHEKDSEGNWDKCSQYNKKLIHYTNLQPMWWRLNLEKGSSISDKDLEDFLERNI